MRGRSIAALAGVAGIVIAALTGCTAPAADNAPKPEGSQAAEFEALGRIEIVAPAAPGSGWDQTARAIQASLQSEKLAQSVEVTNTPGASGTVALAGIAPRKGAEDLLMASGLAMMSGIISNSSPVTLDDLTPVARLIGEYEALVVPAGSPYKSTDDLFAAIKKDPKSVAIAGGSTGSADHLFIGLLAQHYGVNPADINYVPYSGGGEATAALLGNKVQAGIAGLSEFAAQIEDGGLTGLLVSSKTNETNLKFADTVGDIDEALEFTNWRSIMAPGGISAELEQQYLEAIDQMHASASWQAEMEKNGWVDTYLAGDEFDAWLDVENERVAAVLSDLGLKP